MHTSSYVDILQGTIETWHIFSTYGYDNAGNNHVDCPLLLATGGGGWDLVPKVVLLLALDTLLDP